MKTFLTRLRILYQRFFGVVDYLRSPFLLAVRLYWGWQLVQSGWGKLHHLDKVTDYFTTLNLPMPAQMAVIISCVELFGGIFLALGLLSRLTALVLTVNLIAAYITGDREALVLDFFRPRQILRRRPVHFPDRFAHHPDLRPRQALPGHSAGALVRLPGHFRSRHAVPDS